MLISGLAAKLGTSSAIIDVSIMGWGVPGLPKPWLCFLSQLLSMKEKRICLFVCAYFRHGLHIPQESHNTVGAGSGFKPLCKLNTF